MDRTLQTRLFLTEVQRHARRDSSTSNTNELSTMMSVVDAQDARSALALLDAALLEASVLSTTTAHGVSHHRIIHPCNRLSPLAFTVLEDPHHCADALNDLPPRLETPPSASVRGTTTLWADVLDRAWLTRGDKKQLSLIRNNYSGEQLEMTIECARMTALEANERMAMVAADATLMHTSTTPHPGHPTPIYPVLSTNENLTETQKLKLELGTYSAIMTRSTLSNNVHIARRTTPGDATTGGNSNSNSIKNESADEHMSTTMGYDPPSKSGRGSNPSPYPNHNRNHIIDNLGTNATASTTSHSNSYETARVDMDLDDPIISQSISSVTETQPEGTQVSLSSPSTSSSSINKKPPTVSGHHTHTILSSSSSSSSHSIKTETVLGTSSNSTSQNKSHADEDVVVSPKYCTVIPSQALCTCNRHSFTPLCPHFVAVILYSLYSIQ